MPPKIYGAPLPPGLDGSTRGELHIRIDKLILDDLALNRNPLIRFKLGGNDGSAGGGGGPHERGSGSVSPNKFVVPVDYCAVSPLFWGETKPTAYCQPATPGQPSRGATSIVYPIKSSPDNVADYLAGMSSSPHRGLQMEVYVPSSYSGRPAVPVGKSVVFLDELAKGKTISGWYSVVHSQPSTASDEADDDDGDGFDYIPVGKMKLKFQLQFFPSQGSPSSSAAQRSLNVSGEKTSRSAESGEGSGSRNASRGGVRAGHGKRRPAGMNVSFRSGRSGSGERDNHSSNASIEIDMTEGDTAEGDSDAEPRHQQQQQQRQRQRQVDKAAVVPMSGAKPHVHTDPLQQALERQDANRAVSDIVRRGLQLRERMAKAADAFVEAEDGPVGRAGSAGGTLRGGAAYHTGSVENDDDDNDDEGTVYSSEESDDEQFALQLQREQAAKKWKDEHAKLSPPCTATHRNALSTAGGGGGASDARRTTLPTAIPQAIKVTLDFSNFSFAATSMTADLTEMRISVRLSKDITTGEPTTGPFSSYVHQVPLSQKSICLSFDIRGYSEEVSRLVVEFIKVKSTTVTQPKEEGAVADAASARQVVAEEQLGLCIVGVYTQTRELALRDPITSLNNAYCTMSMKLAIGREAGGGGGGEARAKAATANEDTVNMSAVSLRSEKDRHRRHRAAPSRGSSPTSSSATTTAIATSTSTSTSTTASECSDNGGDRRHRGSSGRRHARRHDSTRAREGSRKWRRHQSRSGGASSSSSRPAATGGARMLMQGSPPAGRVERGTVPTVRLCIAIQRAVQLPTVLVASSSTSSKDGERQRQASLALGHRDTPGESSGDDRYVSPNAFFLVDSLRAPVGRQGQQQQRRSDDPSAREINGWTVASHAHGFYDRTHVVPASQTPVFNYSCVLSVPNPAWSPLPPAGSATSEGSRGGNSTYDAIFAQSLGELTLSLWHKESDSAAQGGAGPQNDKRASEDSEREAEVRFWSSSARLGECCVDLKPLRYLPRLDGFYRVTSDLPVFRTEEGGGDGEGTTTHTARLSNVPGSHGSAQTIGHVHVSVWLADREWQPCTDAVV